MPLTRFKKRKEFYFFLRAPISAPIYERRNTGTSPNFTATYSLIEQPIYGSSRIGQRRETSMTIRSVNYTSPASPAPPTQTILQEDATINTAAPVMNWTTVGNYTYTTMSVQRLNTETSTATSSTNQLTLSGVQGSNTTSVDDDCGNVILTSYTARSYNHQQHVCLIFDKFGYLVTNSGGIKSDAEAQSILMKMPGSQNLYYLFTVGTDKVPYYHVIDAGANVVVSKNTPLDAGGGYGRSMTLAEDVTGTGYASRLYLRYFSSGTSYVQSFTITAQGISATSALASFTSGDVRGNGELQISADGTQLTALNNKGVRLPLIQVYSGGGEFRRYDLSADHGTLSGVTTLTTGSNTALETGAWTSTDMYLYYTIRSFPGGVGLERWQQSGSSMSSVTAAPGGTVRRGYNDKLYVSTTNAVNYTEIATPDGTPSVGTVSVSSSAKLRGGLPVQKHKFYLINSCPGSIFTRNLDHKLYELTDHLGNVRVVISDIKESVINGTTNLPENFTTTVEGYYNYYAFGAEMAGRNYVSPLGNYRYGFNGKEKDDEVKGSGNSLDFGARIYDSRLGRWLSCDPLAAKYSDLSPYNFVNNMPLCAVDPDGNLIIFVNGYDISKTSDEIKNQKHQVYDYDPRHGYWGGSNNIHLEIAAKIGDDHILYADGSDFAQSFAVTRYLKGYLAGVDLVNKIKKGEIVLEKNDAGEVIETIKLVAHSQGSAYSAGIAKALGENGYKVEVSYNIAAKQPNDITMPDNVDRIVQYGSDWDMIAPQDAIPNVDEYVFTPEEAKDGPVDGHRVGNFGWILKIKEGQPGYIAEGKDKKKIEEQKKKKKEGDSKSKTGIQEIIKPKKKK